MNRLYFRRVIPILVVHALLVLLAGCSSYKSVFYETEEPYAQLDFGTGGVYHCFVAVGEVSQEAFYELPETKRRSYTDVGGDQWRPVPGEKYCRSGQPQFWFTTARVDEGTFAIRGSADQEEIVDDFTLLVASLLGLRQNFQYGSFSGSEETEETRTTLIEPATTTIDRTDFIMPLYGASYALGKTVVTYRPGRTHSRTTYTREHVVRFFESKPDESAFDLQQVVDSLMDPDSTKVVY